MENFQSGESSLRSWQENYARIAVDEWKQLLAIKFPERRYHQFLAENAGLFLSANLYDAVIISRLKLGAELETDFVIVRDDFSDGLRYVLLEIESPHSKLFTAPNKPSDRLNTALAQITSWRQWLDHHRTQANTLLPGRLRGFGAPARIDYQVVIGRRPQGFDEEERRSAERAWLSETYDVNIISFDRLTENALRRLGLYFQALQGGGRLSAYPLDANEPLSRLAWQATSHSQWMQMIKEPSFYDYHLLERSHHLILSSRVPSPLLRARVESSG